MIVLVTGMMIGVVVVVVVDGPIVDGCDAGKMVVVTDVEGAERLVEGAARLSEEYTMLLFVLDCAAMELVTKVLLANEVFGTMALLAFTDCPTYKEIGFTVNGVIVAKF
jgi:hypothetical protein